MCLKPSVFINKQGLEVTTACRNCRLCRLNRINDWVGRCIAEKQTAASCSFVTLTYGGDNLVTGEKTELGASILIYSDVQRYIRKYRDAGYPCRYVLCGEYGSLKGRSHWHLLLFWELEAPPVLAETSYFTDTFWCHDFDDPQKAGEPFGYSYWVSDVTERDIRYVCKYLLKDEGQDTIFKMSRFPPIGAEYFRLRAQNFAKQGLLPQDAFYSFPDIRVKKTGLPRQFMMQGVTVDNFCREFIAHWRGLYGSHPLDVSHSDFLLDWCDKQGQRVASDQLERRTFAPRPTLPSPEGYGAYRLWETRNLYFCDPVDGFRCLPRLFWSYDEGGYPAWDAKVKTASEALAVRNFTKIKFGVSENYRRESAGLDRKPIR